MPVLLSALGHFSGKKVGSVIVLGNSVEKVHGRSTLPAAQVRASVAMGMDDRIVSAILLHKRIIRCRKLVVIAQVACQVLWQSVAI